MYRSEINIKHSNRSHLYWGIDKATGEVVGIDDVRSRGLNCNCKCAACKMIENSHYAGISVITSSTTRQCFKSLLYLLRKESTLANKRS